MMDQPVRRAGSGGAPGIALGFVHVLERGKISVPRRRVPEADVEEEIVRFDHALERSREQLAHLRKKMSDEQGEEHAYFVEAQALMLEDRGLIEETREILREQRINAEWAFLKSLERFKTMFDKIDDEYFRDRRSDIDYVEERLLRNLAGSRHQEFVSLQRKTVLVAHDLSPADLVKVNHENVAALATDVGGKTSHTVIIARSMGIPVVVGLGDISVEAQNGDRIIVDGDEGRVVIRPDATTWTEAEERRKKYVSTRRELLKNRHHKAETRDQYEVHLRANMDLLEELPAVLANGAEGVGLLRTEHLFLGTSIPPSEEEQYLGYRKVVQKIKPHETVIRLLDLPGDHLFGPPTGERVEHNPALGLRGLRLLLREKEIFRTQLRAILRASAFGKVAILYPMVTEVGELREANAYVAEVMRELSAENVRFDSEIRRGTMIEIPAAALAADELAQESDFFSIGTNDLVQYTLGVDRANELVSHLYQPFHRSVVHLLQATVEAGHKAGIEVGVCGEMAAEPRYIPLLVAMEFNFLSMHADMIPSAKHQIREMTMEEAKQRLADFSLTLSKSRC